MSQLFLFDPLWNLLTGDSDIRSEKSELMFYESERGLLASGQRFALFPSPFCKREGSADRTGFKHQLYLLTCIKKS